MCGIAGVIRWDGKDETEIVAEMTAALAHRGPDAGAVINLSGATMGHRRLSVLDMADTANQPMIESESGACIVFNGEIYNYRELRKQLEEKGVRFRTNGDTEVLFKGLVRFGTAWLEKLSGMFAFAFWNPRSRQLMLARDRLGKKPLYFRSTGTEIAFASELTSLRIRSRTDEKIDPAALSSYLAVGYTPTSRCIISGVEKVPPATFLTFNADGTRQVNQYWNLADAYRNKPVRRRPDEAAEELGTLLDDAVRQRLVSDVPLGTLLSGGLDSAAITESTARLLPDNRIESFTMDFEDQSHSEAAAAAETARVLGVGNTVETMTGDVMRGFLDITRFLDEPLADTSIVPTFHLARMARQNMTVALAGDGGDELFAGYVTHAANHLHRYARLTPTALGTPIQRLAATLLPPRFGKVGIDYKVNRFVGALNLPRERAHYHWRGLFDHRDRVALLKSDHGAARDHDPFTDIDPFFAESNDLPPIEQTSFVDFKSWLVDDILVKTDRMSMAHGLEIRSPFLDHRLVEFAAGLPARWKFNRLKGKRILRHYLSQQLPAAITKRRKAGFNAPVSRWFTGRVSGEMQALTMDGAMQTWFERPFIQALWDDHLAQRKDNGFRLFALAAFAAWLTLDPHSVSGKRSDIKFEATKV